MIPFAVMPMLRRLILPALMLLGLFVFTLGINWGLPSRASDDFLFGKRLAWTGAQIVALAPKERADAGADVDANPIGDRSKPLVLNETDAQRAEIVRRYRLFSAQPDEMITFKSLSSIKQFKGDPRLYQYGGLWVYPVGVMLKLGSMIGVVELKSDQAYYLDNPAAFGKFYVVARFYSAMWGVIGVWAVWMITRKITQHLSENAHALAFPVVACLAYIFLPAVINAAHEAKPHLGGAVLQLLAILCAIQFVQAKREKWFYLCAALCGAAFGMVLSALWIFIVLPVARLQVDAWRKAIWPTLLGLIFGVAVYCITNPFVPINLLREPSIVFSNLGNSTAMYNVSGRGDGITNSLRLIAEGTSTPLAIVGGIGLIVLLVRLRSITLLLIAPVVLVTLQMFALGAGKPPEYGRFALLVDIVLAISAMAWVGQFERKRRREVVSGLLLGWVAFSGLQYVIAYTQERAWETSRVQAAEEIARHAPKILALPREPAPYNCPPVNLFDTKLLLLPPGSNLRSGEWDMIVWPIEAIRPLQWVQTPMSWANVEFVIAPNAKGK